MDWKGVGDWLKGNAGTGAALVGSLLTGNVPGAVASGIALVSSATGTADPAQALGILQGNPDAVLKLKELAYKDAESIREQLRAMEELRLTDLQKEHEQQQLTIRGGDEAEDAYVRHTRPLMARMSWYATMAYVLAAEGARIFGYGSGATVEVAMVLMSPAGAYIGFRTWDKKLAK